MQLSLAIYPFDRLAGVRSGARPQRQKEDTVDTLLILVLVTIGVLLAVAVLAWWAADRRRSAQLRKGFGLEYDRALRHGGSRRRAEADLDARRKRVEKLRLKEISPIRAQEYAERWRIVQGRFVDDPAGSIKQADQLCVIVMNERGYPMADFEQRAADLSVDHPTVVSNYRSAHAISRATDHQTASTESLRQAMMNYRMLFEELLEIGAAPSRSASRSESRVAR
jgi:hypothetical protein